MYICSNLKSKAPPTFTFYDKDNNIWQELQKEQTMEETGKNPFGEALKKHFILTILTEHLGKREVHQIRKCFSTMLFLAAKAAL